MELIEQLMNRSTLLQLLICVPLIALGQWADRSEGNSRSYQEVLSSYRWLDQQFPQARLDSLGMTDAGRPLHLFLFGSDLPEPGHAPREDQLVILVNNGIHPGESCGVDASLQWVRKQLEEGSFPERMILAVIPAYNVGGMLQRRPNTRANQDGPVLQGFRGNSRNLDLNRDFVKADAQNTRSFYRIFQMLDPDIFIDTHTTNGADYPYTMTLIATQQDKLARPLGKFMAEQFTPALYEGMASRQPMVPYVNVFGKTPDKGYAAFLETPRYASGYTALHHCIGYITEAHMLKTYEARVAATMDFLDVLLPLAGTNAQAIKDAREASRKWTAAQTYFPTGWALDSSRSSTMAFDSYAHTYSPSTLGSYDRLKYEPKPKSRTIPFYGRYRATDSVKTPRAYLIPSAWYGVLERMKLMGIQMTSLEKDSLIEVENSYLKEVVFAKRPYEGRFMVQDFKEEKRTEKRLFQKGDVLVNTSGNNPLLLSALLEPRSVDSYLRWGFFHSVFQQKEYFSTYVFEDTAMELLEKDPDLKEAFELWKEKNPEKAGNAYEVLGFIYSRSSYQEMEFLRYPIARIP
ncbi:MAG: hypothetical protein EBT52_04850 [Flavobacteriia bacterium]|nr:hypothetical protein [Flavobacteriia bacterium]